MTIYQVLSSTGQIAATAHMGRVVKLLLHRIVRAAPCSLLKGNMKEFAPGPIYQQAVNTGPSMVRGKWIQDSETEKIT